MSTTVSYKGNTIATVDNNTKTLKTAGKYMEADVILTDSSGGTTRKNISNTWQTSASTTTKTFTGLSKEPTEFFLFAGNMLGEPNDDAVIAIYCNMAGGQTSVMCIYKKASDSYRPYNSWLTVGTDISWTYSSGTLTVNLLSSKKFIDTGYRILVWE